jgi:hypothetical protein
VKAISLWQPWASAIAAGVKTVETRSWPTDYRGPLAIHAAKRFTDDERAFWSRTVLARKDGTLEKFAAIGVDGRVSLPLGAIVATCEIYDCLSTSSDSDAEKMGRHPQAENEALWGNYGAGRFAWLLRNVRAIRPVPCVGRQGFFEWSAPTAKEAQKQ